MIAGACRRCHLRQRLGELLADSTGNVRPELQALHQTLAATDRPAAVLTWLSSGTSQTMLTELAAGLRPLTHAALDELPASKPLTHLRSVLVATGTLPARDEHFVQLERWITQTVAGRADPQEKEILHRYAAWHVLRRLRHRIRGTHATHGQAGVARRNITAAVTFLNWLAARDLTLATCPQADLDQWTAGASTSQRGHAGHFIRWARNQKLTSLDFPATRWAGPTRVIDTEGRWAQARHLLHDDTLKPEDRVAGLLVLLYAQQPATISRLTLGHVQPSGGEVHLRLGREPVVLPEPLASLVLRLVATRQGHATTGDQGTSPWLLPGGRPGQPISPDRLNERLHQIGIRPGPARSTALFQLATELPAAILARMLGIHIDVAVAWQRASTGDWMSLRRRRQPTTRHHRFRHHPGRHLMASWQDLEQGAPRIARPGRARLDQARVVLLGTLRRDGSPRISPVEPYFAPGQLMFGAMAWSGKARDLLRDPRCVMHSPISAPDAGEAELKVYGLAALVDDPLRQACRDAWWLREPRAAAEVFVLDVTEAVLIEWDLKRGQMATMHWSPGRGLREQARRYP